MKKNISININGIIFHIEEDGYNMLREYLDSIKNYFSSLDKDGEIVSDIEGRVAEILASKLSDNKQVIMKKDIASLMQKMGSIDDFKAATQEVPTGEKSKDSSGEPTSEGKKSAGSKRLYRDQKEKIIGGVCAGVGYYFNIDPVWPRLLCIILAIGSLGSLIFVYLILWIAMPASEELEKQSSVRKMFRDPTNKIVGGVASGVAAFLGIDMVLSRILFVLFTFAGGASILIYIVLWIILPEAKLLTEKMQMQGKPVTLSNIENVIKKKKTDEDEDESTLAKIILFPIRLIVLILDKVAKIVGPLATLLVAIMRILVGVFIVFISIIFLIFILAVIAIGWGLTSFSSLWGWSTSSDLSIPIEALSNAFPLWVFIPILGLSSVILLFMLLSGISVLLRKNVFKPIVSWSLLVVFLLSVAGLIIEVPQIVFSFRKKGEYKEESQYVMSEKIPILQLHETGMEDYSVTSLKIIGYTDSVVRVVKNFTARGNTRKDARANAEMVTYNVEKTGDTFLFDSNITFKENAIFRAQYIQVYMYIPFGQPFQVDSNMWDIIENSHFHSTCNCIKNTWQINSSGMVCYPLQQ